MLSVIVEIGHNIDTLLTTLKNPKNGTHSHSLTPIQVTSQFCSVFQVTVLLQAKHPWPAPQKAETPILWGVRKMSPLIQNKSSPPPSILVHLSTEARKKP